MVGVAPSVPNRNLGKLQNLLTFNYLNISLQVRFSFAKNQELFASISLIFIQWFCTI